MTQTDPANLVTTDQPVTQPSPRLFMDTVNAFQHSAALKAAVELGLFTAIGKEGSTAAQIAQKCQAAERAVRMLSDYLTTLGFLTKSGDRYELTADTAMFLDERSPAYLGNAARFLMSPTMIESFLHLAEAVRRGGTPLPDEGIVADEHPIWAEFARAMAPLMVGPARMMAQILAPEAGRAIKVLDVAAGHGLFGITLAQQYPNVEVVALDWPQVLEVARENAGKMGVAQRLSLLPGSAFDVDFGSGYDIVLLTNFLQLFDIPACESVLRKAHAALNVGGRVAIVSFVPNEDRVSPPETAAFVITMLAATPHGDAYTFEEYRTMLRDTGFKGEKLYPLPPTPQQMIVAYNSD